MQKLNSQLLRNKNHSLNKKKSPYSLYSSKNESIEKHRKMSARCLKEGMPDFEKLIMEIKISPISDVQSQHIKAIFSLLKQLQSNKLVIDEVHAVYLLMQNIENKVNNATKVRSRPNSKTNFRKNSGIDQKENSQISPIKLIEQASSRILYTNFSLKQIERNITAQNNSYQSSQKKNSTQKVSISKFDSVESSEEIHKLNEQIKYLEKLLENKTKGCNITEKSFTKKKFYLC